MVVAATGFFDGVHSGHRAVLRRIVELSENSGAGSAVITFWPHPRLVLHHDDRRLRLLNTLDEKDRLIRDCGIQSVNVIPFTEEFGRLGARDFIEEYLVKRYGVDTLVIGYDHSIGCDDKSGEQLVSLVRECGLGVSVVGEESVDSSHVSSTVIRNMIGAGDVRGASRLLGYDYGVRCCVTDAACGRTVMVSADGFKVLPFPAKYRVTVTGGGFTSEAECTVGSDRTMVCSIDFHDHRDMEITFLEKIF